MTAKIVADEILRQIRINVGNSVVWSWGLKNPQYGTEENGNHFLIFSVSGFLHKGKLKVRLEGNDTYTIFLLKRNGEEKSSHTMIYCDEIGERIDQLVECNTSKEEYTKLVNKTIYTL